MAQHASDTDVAFWRGTTWVTVAYLTALVVGIVGARLSPLEDPLWLALYADVLATITIFGFSYAFHNTSLYDPYWSVIPPAIAGYWVLWAGDAGDPTRQVIVLAAISFWAVRLTANWLSYWSGLHHEDWRYVDLQRTTGIFYWPVSLLGLHMFPTLLVFAGMFGAWQAITAGGELMWLDAVATFVTFGAVFLEAFSDRQLAAFKERNTDPQAFMAEGLWAWSRHPNYLGEISFWAGLFLFGLAADPSAPWPIVGPLAMAALFRFISIPMMEKRMVAKRPAYADHIRRSSMLLPWPTTPAREPAPAPSAPSPVPTVPAPGSSVPPTDHTPTAPAPSEPTDAPAPTAVASLEDDAPDPADGDNKDDDDKKATAPAKKDDDTTKTDAPAKKADDTKKATAPAKKDDDTKKATAPAKKDDAPAKKADTPAKKADDTKKATAPAKKADAPAKKADDTKKATASKKKQTAPPKKAPASKKKQTAPKKKATASKKKQTAPKKKDDAPAAPEDAPPAPSAKASPSDDDKA